MCRTQIVLGLVVLYVGFGHSWSWDLAVAHGDLLEFYRNYTKTNTVLLNSHNFGAMAYDEVHNMLLYVDKQSDNDAVCGYDMSASETKCFTERNGRNIHGLSFDPITELLFFSDTNERSINWISLESGSNKYGNLLIKMDHGTPTDVAVDSCRGYVYWINTNLTTPTIERARFNGSEREVIVNIYSLSINKTYKLEPHSLIIDQQTQKMYWMEPTTNYEYLFKYADLNGQHKTSFISSYRSFYFYKLSNPSSNRLTFSETTLFMTDWGCDFLPVVINHLGKTKFIVGKELVIDSEDRIISTIANYKIKEQIQDIKDCDGPRMSLERKSSVGPFCVHGVKVIGQSVCKCAPGYIGERCDLSICENYCLQGNCSVSDEGLPKCRCNAGYSGERCEVNSCHGYCLNNGVCSLNEEDEPSCECVGGYQGSKCEFFQSVTLTFSNNPEYSAETKSSLTDLLSKVRKNTSKLCFTVDEP